LLPLFRLRQSADYPQLTNGLSGFSVPHFYWSNFFSVVCRAVRLRVVCRVATGVCKVYSDKMLTFDGVPLILPVFTSETPSSSCKVLLAQDCSQRGLFSVAGSFKFGRWSVKMVVPSYELELVPESSSADSVKAIVNGQQMRIRQSEPIQLPPVISQTR